METKNNKFSKILQRIQSPEFIYLGIIFIFFVIVLIVFLYSTNFVVNNVNKIFSTTDSGASQALNTENYLLAVKKLNLPTNTAEGNATAPTTATPPVETPPIVETNTPAVVETPQAPTIDKKSITINILNTTSKKGVAAILAKTLENAGFSTATTGNDKKSYNLTTIIISENKKEYLPLLKEAVLASYPKVVTETIANKTDFDVTIMIGKQ